MKKIASLIVFLGLVFSCHSNTFAVSYSIVDVGSLGGNYTASRVINSSGQVAGGSNTSGDNTATRHAFISTNGVIQDLGTLNGPASMAFGINNAGVVVGEASVTSAVQHAFAYSGGTLHDLGSLGGSYSTGEDINDSGQIVGYSNLTGDGATHAFLYENGVMQDLGTPGQNSYAYAINNSGEIAGRFDTGTRQGAFLYSGGVMHDISNGVFYTALDVNDHGWVVGQGYAPPTMPFVSVKHAYLYADGVLHDLGSLKGTSTAVGINNKGDIVGAYDTATTNERAFLYHDNAMIDLNTLIAPSSGWVLQAANGINDNGQITGQGTFNGQVRSFVLTPVPEPSSLAMAVLGFVGLMGQWCRRHTRLAASGPLGRETSGPLGRE